MKEKKQTQGVIEFSRNGHALVIANNKSFKGELFIHKNNVGHALDGDTVSIDIIPDKTGKGIQGVVKCIVNRNRMDFSGVIEINNEKGYAFVRTSGNKMPVDFYVPLNKINGAENGDVVVVKLTKWSKKEKSPSGIVTKVLGKSNSHETEIGEIMFKHGIDYSFPKEVEEEALSISTEISEDEILKRRDMRGITTFSIDSAEAKDLDDALSFRELDNGNFEIGVHIADIGHYVKKGSEIDKEAFKRGTSIYLVDRTLPMLPKKLSNNLASLNPNTDKLTVSVIFEINSDGEIKNHNFKKTVINSNFRFTYDEVQNIIETGVSETRELCGDVLNAISILDKIAKKIRNKRFSGGSVHFNSREPRFILDENFSPIDVYFSDLKDSNQLIEEFMLLANRYVGTFLYKNKIPAAFRVHESPNEEKLLELSTIVKNFGYDFSISGDKQKIKESLNKLLTNIKGSPEENMISTLAVRCMQKATCNSVNIGHYGLGSDFMPPNNAYSWFTSGIRRYADIINQRQLFEFLEKK